jgi:hypothetical protein
VWLRILSAVLPFASVLPVRFRRVHAGQQSGKARVAVQRHKLRRDLKPDEARNVGGFQFRLPGGGGDTLSADGCLLSRRVPAGGTWNDSQAQEYGGCLPAYRESLAGTRVSLTITFTDEQGVAGQVTGSAIAPAPVSSAVLAFSTFELSLQTHRDGSRWYEATVELTETSGRSAALLKELAFRLPNGDGAILGEVCLQGSSGRVTAGGTWKLSQVHPGCLPTWRDSVGTQVTLTVRFTDEHGVAGQVTGTVTAPPPGD